MTATTPVRHPQAIRDYLGFTEIKTLVHRIETLRNAQGVQVIAILSQHAREGKSFLTAVLATGLANLAPQRRVLIVDAAAHWPTQSTLLEETVEPLENVDIIRLKDWKNPNEDALQSSEAKLGALLDRLGGQYGAILIDTCALHQKNRHNFDPMLLARYAGGAVLLTSPQPIEPAQEEANRRRLADGGVKLLGLVHNEVVSHGI